MRTAGGTGRVQADFYTETLGRTGRPLTLNQAWSTPAGMRLSTSASVERINGAVTNGPAADSTVLSLGAFGGGQFRNGLGIDGNVLWARAVQGRAAPGISANVSLTWQMARDWQILATYYDRPGWIVGIADGDFAVDTAGRDSGRRRPGTRRVPDASLSARLGFAFRAAGRGSRGRFRRNRRSRLSRCEQQRSA